MRSPSPQVTMAKRGAATELTQDNWADEDEPEEFGTFKQASSDQLASRQIRKARRRGVVGDAPPSNIFKGLDGFSGFGGSTNSSSQPSFSFLDKNSSGDSAAKKQPSFDFLSKPLSDSVKTSSDSSDKKSIQPFKLTQDSGSPLTKNVDTAKTNGVASSKSASSKLFLANLKALNDGVLQWVKQHLDKNPHVNLSPVFEDYKKHFEELKKKYPPETESETETILGKSSEKDGASEKENKPMFALDSSPSKGLTFGSTKDNSEPSKPAFSFGGAIGSPSDKNTETSKSLFSFGSTSTEKTTETKKLFSFSSSSDKSSDTSKPIFGFESSASSSKENSNDGEKKGFSFGIFDSSKKSSLGSGGGGGFSFAGATAKSAPEASGETKKEEGEPTDEPPKVEVNEVKEDDALYEKKCKLFYMSEGSFVEKGVGTLFLKPAGDKTQLLVRAFTNLGNILLNIILNKSIPTIRAGKNGVIIACIPNPPLDGKNDSKDPVKMLIKVKTSDDADALLEKINELKK